jgi:hypothetical protein
MVAKGRAVRPPAKPGEANHNAKLSEQQVLEIRAKKAAGYSGASIAAEYGISQSRVSEIYHRKSWRVA